MDKIKFKIPKDFKTIAISVNPFDRIGLGNYLHNFAIFGYEDGSWIDFARTTEEEIISLKELGNSDIEKKNSEYIINSAQFAQYIDKFKKIYLFLYKETQAIADYVSRKYKNTKILANSFELNTKLENKVQFRNLMEKLANFPKFITAEFSHEMLDESYYIKLFNELGNKFVIQDEMLSGGKGTFIVNNFQEYEKALEILSKLNRYIVFSEFVEGRICSIQCCATKYGIVSTGIQEQIISNDYLTNAEVTNGGTFCGGQFGYNTYSEEIESQGRALVNEVGVQLRKLGYKGIFGLDIIVSNNKIYLIEMNPRITGLSLMITMLQEKNEEISLQLLHFLELAGIDYEIENPEILNKYFNSSNKKGSFLVLQNRLNQQIKVKNSLTPGIYSFQNGFIKFLRNGYKLKDIKNINEFIITATPKNDSIKSPGSRVLRIITLDKVINMQNLTDKYIEVIKFIESHYEILDLND